MERNEILKDAVLHNWFNGELLGFTNNEVFNHKKVLQRKGLNGFEKVDETIMDFNKELEFNLRLGHQRLPKGGVFKTTYREVLDFIDFMKKNNIKPNF